MERLMPGTLAYRVGAWCWIATGIGHLSIEAALSLASASPESARLKAAMRENVLAIGGVPRTSLDVVNGISIAMGLALVLAGVLFLMIARVAGSAEQTRGAAGLGLVASLVLLVVAVIFLPLPPIVTFTASSASFAVALGKLPRR
ncbi:LIC_13387 family protein [Nannocystis radixulma]|uniref:DUF4064 domain-containing protein n=1 Tax=Nannocystis radixulma TaxID=2995305 RepID=A0ABT5BHZ1_9BACT|nr:hypothetical protein [Nannocystis radixulma]MDC0673779.1 hypothetical protein [Nannocystis radixulma]